MGEDEAVFLQDQLVVVKSRAGSANMNGVISVTDVSDMVCPGSPAGTHAGMMLTAIADASCAYVEAEVNARVAGQGGWIDPHNQGTYSQWAHDGGTLSFKRRTGDDKYTDAMVFTLTDDGAKCKIEACS